MMSNFKTADGVDYEMGMTLATSEGEPFLPDDVSDQGDYYWVEHLKHSGNLNYFFSSKEAFQEFVNSPQHLCFCCKKKCGPHHSTDHGSLEVISMSDGLIFRATGNYGSAIFDPASYQALQIKICDDCVTERVNQVTYFPPDGSKGRMWKLEQEEVFGGKRPRKR